MTLVLGAVDVTLVNQYRSGQVQSPVLMAWFAPHRPQRSPDSGGDTKSTNYPVDDVHQACITLHGASGLGMAFGEDKKTDRLLSPESTPNIRSAYLDTTDELPSRILPV